jgi:hypothetical protein
MKITKATAWLFTAELIRLGAAARGIRLEEAFQPREIGKQTQEIQDLFAGLYNDIAMGFGNTFEEAASAFFNAFNFAAGKVGLTFELLTNLIKGLWEDVKRAFFRVIGEMVTRWVTDGVGKIIKETKDAGNVVTTTTGKMGSEFGAVGNIIIQVAKTIGTVITTLVTAIATAVTTLVTTIGTGIVTLATAIATAINILAAAAPALLEIGLVAAAIYTAFKAGEALVGGLSNLIGGGGGDNSDITYWLKPISERAQEMRDWLFINGQEHLLTIRQILGDISAKTQEVRDSINGGLIAVLNAILGVERDTYKALTATHTIHVIDDALLDSHRDVVASLAGIARAGLPSGLADSAGRGAMGLGGLADSALYKRAHAERHTFVYAPQVSAIDAAGVMKFVRGPMRDEFIRMVRDNSGGVTKALAVETGKYTAR